MARWLTLYWERMPPAVLILTAGGLALTSRALQGLSSNPTTAAWTVFLAMLFFCVLRLMDEVKDYHKDLVAHPERPLPRGLVTVDEAKKGIKWGMVVMVAAAISTFFIAGSAIAAWLYLVTTVYLWLMYKEFYLGSKIEPHPFFYAVTHQIVVIPLAATMAMAGPGESWPALAQAVRPGLLIIGAFFTFELCRKLDPSAHPLLKTYRATHGVWGTFGLVVFTMALFGWGLHVNGPALGWAKLPLMISGGLLLAVYALFAGRHFKLVEGAAGLLLLLTLWLPVVASLWP